MLLARVFGRKSLKRLVFLFLAAGWATFAGAQELPKAQASAARTIVLPEKIVAGTSATLAVLDSAGGLLSHVVVELSGGQKVSTDATGRAMFVVPGEAGRLTAKIPNQEISASSIVVTPEISATQAPGDGAASQGVARGLQVVSYPHFVAIHDRFTIEGKGFLGMADANHVFLGDQHCLVVASSPVSLVVVPGPRIPIGATALRVSVAGQDTKQMPVSAVLLDFSGPAEAPDAGTQGKIILRVHGTTESVAVEVRNESPEIIQLSHGNVQRLATSGGAENVAPVELKFLAAGNYTVTAKLTPSPSGTPHRP